MLSIGEFARHGRVSVRMLRHDDSIALLVPDRVDPVTGYRSYAAAQLAQLNRLVALKDLGFTLEQIRPVLMSAVGVKELHGMLRLRHAQLAAQITADTERLSEVERRLRSIEKENTMSEHEYVLKALPAIRLAQLTATVHDQSEIGPLIGPMFTRLVTELPRAGVALGTESVATYDRVASVGNADDSAMSITAGFPVTVDQIGVDDVQIVDLPGERRAATVLHQGSMATIGDAWQALHTWIEQNGHEASGPCREHYLQTPLDRPDDWVTELQQPVR